ncbi:hypothetical protein [Cellulosimicrobium marinum]|uniref:hypothetical protein n=1 Tax=Cellulosimicrobium marinum TaxID=1638992 RepID=UPI001E49392A|nr:hypothetical protein [Cellulosimicrobium marinum]MCB7135377.1 hypothetical protein [Cellulosimicrobium marinum]
MALHEHLRVGSRCTAANRAVFWWRGESPMPGALELAWEDGSTLVFDVESDWTLAVTGGPWRNPYAGINTDDPSWDLGTWTKESVGRGEPGLAMVGKRLLNFMPLFNEVGEMAALDLIFEADVLRLEVNGGDLAVREILGGTDA